MFSLFTQAKLQVVPDCCIAPKNEERTREIHAASDVVGVEILHHGASDAAVCAPDKGQRAAL